MYAVPDQTGRLAVITGANSGTGKEAAKRLARGRRPRDHGGPYPGQGRAGQGRDPGRPPARPARGPPRRPGRPRLRGGVRRLAGGRRRADRPAAQQRRGDDAADPDDHRRRLRAAVRQQLPRPVRADHALAADRCSPRPRAGSSRWPRAWRTSAGSGSTIHSGRAGTARPGPTPSPSWPTCSSPANSPPWRASAAGRWPASPPTPATPGPTCRPPGPASAATSPDARPAPACRWSHRRPSRHGTEPLLYAATSPDARQRRLLRPERLHGAGRPDPSGPTQPAHAR